ncbi:hypothetical protein LTR91_011127 [Friedmanniomyces endolithicus]|uniref:Mediator complex subunit 9 n=1 Tax=Friedmanniomyces endolithicus TaxID=329885 RepID=A0AAN6QSW6_9PEZI|nr:hypothetical protein LTR57_018185 [Friedmanniomyces endolithicus]KAK0962643.1 hypothetical protein LTS01_019702 [Friedmanniomyces endolithicus]KAK0983762.1 hypothetical protein LTR91_011127 [Friedmanniomyces endolithicus]KAK1022777.1 hypothetical protein LTS16_025446 [Friedmanniomyces endolithicus]
MAVPQATAPRSTTQPSQPRQPQLPAPTPPTQQPPLPPPQLFDILPALHELLARIDHSSPITYPPSFPPINASNEPAAESLALNYSNLHPLDPKDLPSAILPLKAQMRRGLVELGRLGDMERSVEEQGEEGRGRGGGDGGLRAVERAGCSDWTVGGGPHLFCCLSARRGEVSSLCWAREQELYQRRTGEDQLLLGISWGED